MTVLGKSTEEALHFHKLCLKTLFQTISSSRTFTEPLNLLAKFHRP